MRAWRTWWARYRDVVFVAAGLGLLAALVWVDSRALRAGLALAFLVVGWAWR